MTNSPPAVLRLAFARGTSPSKWVRRWADARRDLPLEITPLTLSGRMPAPRDGEAALIADVTLERVAPGARPAGTTPDTPAAEARFAVRLYTEGLALVIAADHELAQSTESGDELLELVQLLDHPDHHASWPEATPWQDPAWMPRNATAAMELVATGTGAILLPLPLARHLAKGRTHLVLPLSPELEIAGTEIWASWAASRDDADIQQLVGVMRGRTSRSSRTQQEANAAAADTAPAKVSGTGTTKKGGSTGKKPATAKNGKRIPPSSRRPGSRGGSVRRGKKRGR